MNAQNLLSERGFSWCSTLKTSCLLSFPTVRKIRSLAGLDLHMDTGAQDSKLGLSGSSWCWESWSPDTAKCSAFLPTAASKGVPLLSWLFWLATVRWFHCCSSTEMMLKTDITLLCAEHLQADPLASHLPAESQTSCPLLTSFF